MCGIWSLIEKSCNQDKEKIKSLLNDFWNIKHRGPDNSHFETFDNVYTGFHRLAIMDTSFKSNQPYVIRDGNRTIVFICNGEIYNYSQVSKEYNFDIDTSDCLVIPKLYIHHTNKESTSIHKWLDMFNDKIKGEYAFVLFEFDEMMKLSKYFVGRDHVGVRPLYMCQKNDELDFYSSEIKGMINYHGKVEEFPPGHIKIVICNTFNYEEEYYNFSDLYTPYISVNKVSHNDLTKSQEQMILKNVRTAVVNSIKRRLIAHRPMAFLLSGGLDSSLVAAISAKILGHPIRTFCCGMKGSTDMIYAKIVADHIGSNHTEIYFTEEEGLEALEDVIYTTETWDTTTIRASVGQYMVSKYIGTETDCGVVMVGEGPDEVCSSYLFNFYAPNETAINESAKEYVKNIHMYDGKRADRCISRWGLEARVPFLDPEFIRTYWSIPSVYRHPNFKGIEKWWLRKAFDGLDLLPTEVLWRQKEAFSDGISSKKKSWFDILQGYIETKYNDELDTIDHTFKNAPTTIEAKYYRKIFLDKFGLVKDCVLSEGYWQPKWDKNGNEYTSYIDPSARILDVYNNE